MKKSILLLILMLLISSCKTIKEEEDSFPKPDAKGFYALKNLSLEQLEKLADESDKSLAEFIEKREQGYGFARYLIHNGDTTGRNVWLAPSGTKIDVICLPNVRQIIERADAVTITPNPTTSNINVKLFDKVDEKYIKILSEAGITFNGVKVNFQLVYNERIIHQWTDDFSEKTITISEEYLKEGGSYALVCNFIGHQCTRSASASFMVIKR